MYAQLYKVDCEASDLSCLQVDIMQTIVALGIVIFIVHVHALSDTLSPALSKYHIPRQSQY